MLHEREIHEIPVLSMWNVETAGTSNVVSARTPDVESISTTGTQERPTRDVGSTRMTDIKGARTRIRMSRNARAKRRDLLHELRRNEPRDAQRREEGGQEAVRGRPDLRHVNVEACRMTTSRTPA